jgi:protein-S-isoprenylcysteine O-methyltransferase Ste14
MIFFSIHPSANRFHVEVIMSEFEFRVATFLVLIVGLITRQIYKSKFKRIPRDAPRGNKRDVILYYVVLFSFTLCLLYVFTTLLDFAHMDLAGPVRWFGFGLGVLSIYLLIWSHNALGKNWSGVVQLSDSHTLVTDGPYKYMLHPMYTSLFLYAISLAFMTANMVLAILCIGSVVVMYFARSRGEENMMMEAFGEAYKQHMQKVGRLLPRVF